MCGTAGKNTFQRAFRIRAALVGDTADHCQDTLPSPFHVTDSRHESTRRFLIRYYGYWPFAAFPATPLTLSRLPHIQTG